MTQNIIEVISDDNPSGIIHRLKVAPILRNPPGGLRFCPFGQGGEHTAGLLINGLYIDPDKLQPLLSKRAGAVPVMLLLPDIVKEFIGRIKSWSRYVDIFLVATPETKKLLELFTHRQVEVLFDPIDYSLSDSYVKPAPSEGPLKVIWFGFANSYHASMVAHASTLTELHRNGEIEYHLVTQVEQQGPQNGCIMHNYDSTTFLPLLQSFDACVLSHLPADLNINTYNKSENKAVLAINRGVPVVASRTPAYERLLTACGLEDYLFTSNAGLADAIARLREPSERTRYLELSQSYVLKNYSAGKMIEDWHMIYQRAVSA